jgi:hypothetical protein
MTVLMFQKRFVEPIKTGTKRQTIRPKRKRPIKPGEALSLRHWEDKAYRSPQIEFFQAISTGTLPIQVYYSNIFVGSLGIAPITEIDAFARADGFENWHYMREFFGDFYGFPFFGDLILWEDSK